MPYRETSVNERNYNRCADQEISGESCSLSFGDVGYGYDIRYHRYYEGAWRISCEGCYESDYAQNKGGRQGFFWANITSWNGAIRLVDSIDFPVVVIVYCHGSCRQGK